MTCYCWPAAAHSERNPAATRYPQVLRCIRGYQHAWRTQQDLPRQAELGIIHGQAVRAVPALQGGVH